MIILLKRVERKQDKEMEEVANLEIKIVKNIIKRKREDKDE